MNWKICVIVGLLSAISNFTANVAWAQTEGGEESEDFQLGNSGPADNQNSEYASGVRLELPTVQGSGCPAGSVSAALSPDNRTLSLIFSEYVAKAGAETGVRLDRRFCSINIPVVVPPGYQFSIVKIDYRGFMSLPAHSYAHVASTYLLDNGGRGFNLFRRQRRQIFVQGPIEQDYVLSSRVRNRLQWSACGQNANLKIRTETKLQAVNVERPAMITIDSLDASAQNVEYALNWQKCDPNKKQPRILGF